MSSIYKHMVWIDYELFKKHVNECVDNMRVSFMYLEREWLIDELNDLIAYLEKIRNEVANNREQVKP